MKLAAGVSPVPQMLRAGVNVGLGTDGAASNNDLSLWEEIDTAAKLHKLISKDPTTLQAREVIEMTEPRETELGAATAPPTVEVVLNAAIDQTRLTAMHRGHASSHPSAGQDNSPDTNDAEVAA